MHWSSHLEAIICVCVCVCVICIAVCPRTLSGRGQSTKKICQKNGPQMPF